MLWTDHGPLEGLQWAVVRCELLQAECELNLVPNTGWGKDGDMNKEKFLTVRWNNWLALGLGIPALAYAVVALSTSLASELWGFIGIVVIGVLY